MGVGHTDVVQDSDMEVSVDTVQDMEDSVVMEEDSVVMVQDMEEDSVDMEADTVEGSVDLLSSITTFEITDPVYLHHLEGEEVFVRQDASYQDKNKIRFIYVHNRKKKIEENLFFSPSLVNAMFLLDSKKPKKLRKCTSKQKITSNWNSNQKKKFFTLFLTSIYSRFACSFDCSRTVGN
jgi:hypothetical protein